MAGVGRAGADAGERLRALARGATTEDVVAFFDELPPVRVAEMTGVWRGSGLPTGHRLDGLLERFGWYGKRVDGPDGVHPLLVDGGRRGVLSVNPALVPLSLVVRYAPLLRNPVAAGLFRLLRGVVRTREPRARLRMTEYRGVVSATLCYDALPVHDVFRRVDGDTVLGLMDLRGSDRPFAFVLRRGAAGGPGATT
jgi:hypothetical protein